MQHQNLCDRIIKLDRQIRFAGIVNGRGEVIEGGFQNDVQPLLDGTDEQQMYVQSLSSMTALERHAGRLGKVRYSFTECEKVSLFTFPLKDSILCVSTSSRADPIKILDKIRRAIKVRPANARKSNRRIK